MLPRILAVTTLAIATTSTALAGSFSQQLSGSLFGEAGRKHGIDPYLIYSIALVESAYSSQQKGFVAPYTYALRSGLGAEYPATLAEAESALIKHLAGAKTLHSVDVCLMQVNLGWNGHRVNKPADLLNARTCIDTGAAILKDTLSSTDNLYEAIGRYHTWSNKEAASKYATKVITIYNKLPRT